VRTTAVSLCRDFCDFSGNLMSVQSQQRNSELEISPRRQFDQLVVDTVKSIPYLGSDENKSIGDCPLTIGYAHKLGQFLKGCSARLRVGHDILPNKVHDL
jgi:hypothetical protein